MKAGFTTHENAEAANKRAIKEASRSCLIAGDSSKIGIVLESKFADFEDSIRFVVNEDRDNAKLQEIVTAHGDKVLLA